MWGLVRISVENLTMPNKKKNTSFMTQITKTMQETIEQLMESQRRRDEELIQNMRDLNCTINTRFTEVGQPTRNVVGNLTVVEDSAYDTRRSGNFSRAPPTVGIVGQMEPSEAAAKDATVDLRNMGNPINLPHDGRMGSQLDNLQHESAPPNGERSFSPASHLTERSSSSANLNEQTTNPNRNGLENSYQTFSANHQHNNPIGNNGNNHQRNVSYTTNMPPPPWAGFQPPVGPIFPSVVYPLACPNKPSFKPHYVSTYDGSSSWSDYERQVEDAARFYGWSAEEKLMAVTSNLRGRALRLYGTISSSPAPTYQQVRQLMRDRFSLDAHASYQAFRQCVQGPKESVEDFATELERLSLNAFNGAPKEMVTDIVMHQFIDGLRDTQLQGLIVASRPFSISEALRTALDLQAQMNRSKPRNIYQIDVETANEGNRTSQNSRRRNRRSGNERESA